MKFLYGPRKDINNNLKTIKEIKEFLVSKGFYPPQGIKRWYKTLDFEWFKQAMK
jgi:spore coat protein CotF